MGKAQCDFRSEKWFPRSSVRSSGQMVDFILKGPCIASLLLMQSSLSLTIILPLFSLVHLLF